MKFPPFAAEQGLGRSSGSHTGQALSGLAGAGIHMMDGFTNCVLNSTPITQAQVNELDAACPNQDVSCWASRYFLDYSPQTVATDFSTVKAAIQACVANYPRNPVDEQAARILTGLNG